MNGRILRALMLLALAALCGGLVDPDVAPASEGRSAEAGAEGSAAAENAWSALLKRRPFGYTPLPPEARTLLDGTYTKIDPKQEPRVHCLRCPDYAPEGGLWKINFDRGVFRILHAASGWKTIGSFAVEGDRLTLFNDPVCPEAGGTYRWSLADGRLILEALDDPCAIRLRAMNLAHQPWLGCRPPNIEAAVTGHWPAPEGCE